MDPSSVPSILSVSQKTLAFIHVWRLCLDSKKQWEVSDMDAFCIEERLRYLGSTEYGIYGRGTMIIDYWYYAAYFTDFVEKVDVGKFVYLLDQKVAEAAGFPELGVERDEKLQKGLEEDDDSVLTEGQERFNDSRFLATCQSFMEGPRKWAQIYADFTQTNYGTPPLFLYNFIAGDPDFDKKWELFKFDVISAGLIKSNPTDKEWDDLFLTCQPCDGNSSYASNFSLWSIAGKVRLALIEYNFNIVPKETGVAPSAVKCPWFDVIATPKRI